MRFLKPGLIQAVCLAILLSACGGEEGRKAAYLEKGKAYFEEGNYDKAKIEFRNVLQIDPKFAEGFYMMGLMEEKNKNLRKAFGNFAKAVELDPTHINAQAKLGQFYLLGGEIDKAKETLDIVVKIDPGNIVSKFLKLSIMARTEDKAAIAYAKEIIENDPSDIKTIRLLALIYMKDKHQDEAIAVLKKGVETNSDDISLKMLLAKFYANAKDFKNAEIVVKDIISLDPENLAPYVTLALFYTQRGELDKAEQTFRKMISLDPLDAQRYLFLAEFQGRHRSINEAEKTLLSGIEKNPEAFKIRYVLGELYKLTKSEKLRGVYKEIITLNGTGPEGLKARNELAVLALADNDVVKAEQLINEVLNENPRDNAALLTKGKIEYSRKDFNAAISAFRTVVKDQPDRIDAVYFLAMVHSQNKELELAGEVLAQGVTNAPDKPKSYINYASYLEKTGDLDGGEKVIDKLLAAFPKDINGLKMKVKFASSRRDLDEVKLSIEKIKVAHPNKPDGNQLLGDYYDLMKQYPKAIIEYEAALVKYKKLLPSMASIVKIYLKQQQYDMATTRLNKVIKEQPENAVPYELLGEVYLSQKKYAQAEQVIRKAMSVKPKWSLPYSSLASMYLVQKNMQGAVQVYLKALEILPKNTELMAKLAQTYERSDDFDSAIKIYENILSIDPASIISTNNLAVLLADKRGDDRSLQRAKELTKHFEKSNNPAYLDTLGWIYYKLGEFDKAVPVLEKVVDKVKNIPIFQYHMGMAYFKTNNKDAAKVYLNKALEGGKKFQGRDEAEQVIKNL